MKLTIKTKQVEFELDDPKNRVIKDTYDLNSLLGKVGKFCTYNMDFIQDGNMESKPVITFDKHNGLLKPSNKKTKNLTK